MQIEFVCIILLIYHCNAMQTIWVQSHFLTKFVFLLSSPKLFLVRRVKTTPTKFLCIWYAFLKEATLTHANDKVDPSYLWRNEKWKMTVSYCDNIKLISFIEILFIDLSIYKSIREIFHSNEVLCNNRREDVILVSAESTMNEQ